MSLGRLHRKISLKYLMLLLNKHKNKGAVQAARNESIQIIPEFL